VEVSKGYGIENETLAGSAQRIPYNSRGVVLKAVFFSDMHCIQGDLSKIALIQKFASDVLSAVDNVYILGDLFEFYHGYDGYIYPWYKDVADVLKDLTGSGKTVVFLEGNHEFGMGPFFENYTGVTCGRERVIDLDGKKVFISHGDGSGLFCLGSILKSTFIHSIMDFLGPAVTWNAARLAGVFLSRKTKPRNVKIRDIFRKLAGTKLTEGYDTVIFGHSHMADKMIFDINNKKKVYLNTGDFGTAFDYILYDSNTGFTLEKYNPQPPF
jgi:UDP-2,3-diacylglucosamine hydrolase